MEPKTMTLKLNDDQLEVWRDIAKQAGFVMKRGKMVGAGSVQQLMEAVANNEYKVAIWPVHND